MTQVRRPGPGPLLALVPLLALAVAGAWSLANGRPLRGVLAGLAAGESAAPVPKDGLYRVHPDPLVGYVLRPDTDRDVAGARVRADALGLRARPGPPAGPDPLRIVVAGDSVAFGFGLDDDRTIARRLEEDCRAALPPDARPVECRSVALPGWNFRNSVHAVLDHLDVLDPDIVVFLPVSNDLFDTDALDETGHRRTAPDPASDDPWLLVNQSISGHMQVEALQRLRDEGHDAPELVGPQVLQADLTPESSRRYDRNADALELLARTLASRGAHLLVAPCFDDVYSGHLLRRFADRGVAMDVVPLFSVLPPELRLPDDPHPDARAAAAMARWIAADLQQRGWLGPAAAPLPPVDADLAALRAPQRTPAEVQWRSTQARKAQARELRPLIDLASGEGCRQILGGVHADLAAGPHSLFVLPRSGLRLEVTLAPLPARPDLYPLVVMVAVDGTTVCGLVVPASGEIGAAFDLPPAEDGRDVCEVTLLAPAWAVVPTDGGAGELVSFRPLRIRCAPY